MRNKITRKTLNVINVMCHYEVTGANKFAQGEVFTS